MYNDSDASKAAFAEIFQTNGDIDLWRPDCHAQL
jgi:hypothetical protein